jgi:hypothetical protein
VNIMNTRNMIFLGCLAALTLGSANPAVAQDDKYGQPGDWLTSYQTARTSAMGGAYVANADGALGAVWNPAGLSRMLQNQVHFESTSLFGESRMNAFSFALPGRRFPSVGISLITLNSGDFQRTNELNDDLGSFSEGNMAFYITGAKKVGNKLRLGANLKIARQEVEEFSASGAGLDLGAILDLTPNWSLGASFLNVGGPNLTMREVDESYPVNMRGGVAYRALNGRALLSVEVNAAEGPGAAFHSGGEVWVHRSLALRAGYGQEAVGGGVSLRVSPDFRFDYGAQDNELGVLHRFGIVYEFGGFHANSQATPEVFSPAGDHSVTTFDLKAYTRGEPAEWTLDIIDKHKELVRRFGGKGGPPAHVLWDGTDEAGMPLADGTYRYRLVVLDNEGVQVDAKEREVVISTGGPQGAIPVEVD